MTTAKDKTTAFTATSPKPALFDYSKINILLPDMEDGVLQLVPIPFKFEQPGQRIIGVYMGNTSCVSSYDEERNYLYHRVWLPSGHMVGFHGSIQLDSAIASLQPERYELDIEFLDAEALGKGKNLKHFSIAARVIRQANYPQIAAPGQMRSHKPDSEIPF